MSEQTINNICIYPHSGKIQDPDDQIHEVIDAIRVFGDGYDTPIVEEGVADKRTLFVSVGGDGTMLKAAKDAVKHSQLLQKELSQILSWLFLLADTISHIHYSYPQQIQSFPALWILCFWISFR